MKIHLVEKTVAICCALCIAACVMSSSVFARADESSASGEMDVEDDSISDEDMTEVPAEAEVPDSVYVVIEDLDEEGTVAAEITDNRTVINYYLNGIDRGQCKIIDGIPYVSAPAFCFEMGLTVSSTITDDVLYMTADGITLTAAAGALYVTCNGRCLYVEDGVQYIGGQMLLPVEVLAKCLGLEVVWDRSAWTISVWSDGVTPLESGDTYYDETDLYWLSHVIYAEAGNQSLIGMIAVGDVVLHRVADTQFPSTVYDVIFAKNQFDVVANGMIYMTPSDAAVIAAELALEGTDVVPEAEYFATYAFSGYECVAWIGAHCFMAA